MKERNQVTPAKRLLFVSVLVIFPIILIETCSMTYYFIREGKVIRPPLLGGPPVLSPRPEDGYEFDPLTIWTNRDARIYDSLFAKKDIALPAKAPDEFRVFLLGGSTVADLRMPVGDRLADHIQFNLKIVGRNARVYNMGVPSYTSTNEVFLFLTKLVYEKPDMVIVYDGANDAYYATCLDAEFWQPNQTDLAIGYHRRMNIFIEMRPYERLSYTINAFMYTPFLINDLQNSLSSRPESRSIFDMTETEFLALQESSTQARIAQDPVQYANQLSRPDFISERARYNEEAVDVYVNNIRTMAALAESRGIQFLHILQPTALTQKKRNDRVEWSLRFNEAYTPGFSEFMVMTFAKFSVRLRDLEADFPSRRTEFLDLHRFTDNNPEALYDDYVHAMKDSQLTKLMGVEIARAAMQMQKN